MDIDVKYGEATLPLIVEDPFHMDLETVSATIENFLKPHGLRPSELHLRELLPGMVRGICGCQSGCPADAQGFVRRGCREYRLEYIEGGILKAVLDTPDDCPLEIRMFPEF